MPDAQPITLIRPCAPEPARFTWLGLGLAIMAAPMVGTVWARVAQVVQSYFAPIILFPLLVGVFCGLTIIGLARLAHVGHRRTILTAAVLSAVVAAAGQHYFSYLSRYRWRDPAVSLSPSAKQELAFLSQEFARQLDPGFGKYLQAHASNGRPLPGGYVAKGWLAWFTWAIDALLVVVGAVGVAIPALTVPYCNRCRSWYRTIRNGKIDLATAARLAELLDVEPPDRPRSARYRLSACQGGCAPSRFELSWEHADSVDLVRVWLDAKKWKDVAAILDRLPSEDVDTK